VEPEHDVLHLQAPEEVLEEEPGDFEDVGTVLDPGLLPAVFCRVGDVAHAEPADVEPDHDVVAVAVAGIDVVKADAFERPGGDGGVAVLRVHHLPVAGRDLGEESEDGVADEPPGAHALAVRGGEEAVADGVVAPAVDDGVEEHGEDLGVHLVVACHDCRHLDAVGEGCLVPGDDGGADTLVDVVADGDDSPVADGGLLDVPPGGIFRAVIDDVDFLDKFRDGGEGLLDQGLLVVGRDDDCDAETAVAGCSAPILLHGISDHGGCLLVRVLAYGERRT